MKLNLYRVNLVGPWTSWSGTDHSSNYVVATNAQEAYDVVKKYLDEKDYGTSDKRQLKSVELLAEDYQYAKTMLFSAVLNTKCG